jgi:hypothetical protein
MPRPPIDYTNLGYEALRASMLALARERVPEWTDHSPNDLGVLLIELFAYACDITLYYQSRIAGNLFPATADEPDALVQLLRLIGYELRPPAPATAILRLAFDAPEPTPIAIPSRTQFFCSLPSGEQLTFETQRDVAIQAFQLTPPDVRNLRYCLLPIEVVQGETVLDEAIGTSDASPNQTYRLTRAPIIAGSIEVSVVEPGGLTRWSEVTTLAESGPADRHFITQRDAAGSATIVFGDGSNGLIPPRGTALAPVTIRATYRSGGGPAGNVPANSSFRPALPNIREALNPQAAAGGTAGEDVDYARVFASRVFRTQERAVSTEDYTDVALRVPGVGKARAVALNWNEVALFVAPAGQVGQPSEYLVRDLLAFFETHRMATTALRIVGPQAADIYIRANVQAQPYFLQTDVRAKVERAVSEYLAFDAVEFGQPIYLSKVYDVIQSLPEVVAAFVSEFSLQPDGTIDADGVIQLGPNELPRLGYRDNPDTPPDPANPTFRPPLLVTIEGGVAR